MDSLTTVKVPQPQYHKAKVVIWSALSLQDLEALDECESPELLKIKLSKILHLERYETDKKSAVLLDLFFYVIQFARQHKFSKEQTSAFFSIVKNTHDVCIETPVGNVEHCFSYFRELVLCHAVNRPPWSVALFDTDQVKAIVDYVINTYFRHFKLYKYVFTPVVKLDLSFNYIGVPASPEPEEVAVESAADSEPEGEVEVPPADDGGAAAEVELRNIVKQQIAEEISKAREMLDTKIKESEDVIITRLAEAEGQEKPARDKAAKSAKKKKK